MKHRMSAKDYRSEFVEPALKEEGVDSELLDKINNIKDKKSRKLLKAIAKGPLEHDIQDQILDVLGHIKGFFWRENSGRLPVSDKNGTRHIRAGIKGICDIIGVYKGRFIGIEVKRPETKDNVSLHQLAFIETVRLNGGVAFVCWDALTVIDQLEAEMLK